MVECGQVECSDLAVCAFVWPGDPLPRPACAAHRDWAVAVGAAMGFHVPVVPLG